MAGDRVRDEAERLVAAAITAVSLAARGMGARGSNFANGSPECCVCPVCRVISTMRDPGADLADRVASGAGDLATGVASLLRALSRPSGHAGESDREATREGDEFWESLRRRATSEATAWRARASTARGGMGDSGTETADPWRVATSTGAPTAPAKPMAKKAVAKKTVAKKAASPQAAERPEPAPGPETSGASAPAVKKVAKKAGRAKAAPAQVTPAKVTPAKVTPAKVTPAKAAKKAAKKAVPPPADFG